MQSPLTIRVGGVPEHFNFAWHVAIESGKFMDANLDIQFRDYPGGTGSMTAALRDNELEMAIVLTEGAVADILENDSNRIVKTYVDSPLIWGIHVPPNSPIRSINQVDGKRYAISRPGSGSHLMAIVDAAERNWSTGHMQFVEVGDLAGARKAFKQGRADVFFWERYTTQPFVDSGEFRRVDQRKIPWPAFVVSTNRMFLKKHPDAVYRTMSILNEFSRDLMNSTEAVGKIAKRYQLKKTDTQSWFEKTQWSTDFKCPGLELERCMAELKSLGIVKTKDVNVNDVWECLGYPN